MLLIKGKITQKRMSYIREAGQVVYQLKDGKETNTEGSDLIKKILKSRLKRDGM
ncbi:MAG: hypothetical protein JSV31_21245 [Desulfobacterales bacterium]|nr:MAG: hypothetical protein JSV31_21245 [Desulfobacterales bacterium]